MLCQVCNMWSFLPIILHNDRNVYYNCLELIIAHYDFYIYCYDCMYENLEEYSSKSLRAGDKTENHMNMIFKLPQAEKMQTSDRKGIKMKEQPTLPA